MERCLPELPGQMVICQSGTQTATWLTVQVQRTRNLLLLRLVVVTIEGEYVQPSATTIVPLGGDINTYITNATAGDTLVLSSGTYTVTADIAVSKQLNIVGQGNAGLYSVVETDLHGTRIFCDTNNVSVFNITASNVRIADLSIITQGGGTAAKGIETANNLNGLVFQNIDVVMESGAGTKTAFDVLGSDAIIRDSTFTVVSSNSTAYGVYVHNNSSTTINAIVDVHTTNGWTDAGGTRSSSFYVYNDNDANTITMNLFSSWGQARTGTANDVAAYANSATTNNAKLNVYQSTLDGADYDIQQSGTNVITIYGGILVNNTPSGSVTYGGTVAADTFTGTIENATNTAITNDDATNATMYPTWVTADTGNLPQKTSSTNLTWNPSTGTLGATVFSGNLLPPSVQSLTCTDSGDGNPGALTITPTATLLRVDISLTVNDSDGCTITMAETGAVEGTIANIVNISAANTATFLTSAGVLTLKQGSAFVMAADESLTIQYKSSEWLEIGRIGTLSVTIGGSTDGYELVSDGSGDFQSTQMVATEFIPIGWFVFDGTTDPGAETEEDNIRYRDFDTTTAEEGEFLWSVPEEISGSTVKIRAIAVVTNATTPADTEGVSWGIAACSSGTNDTHDCTVGTIMMPVLNGI
jgi:hypothetical protein